MLAVFTIFLTSEKYTAKILLLLIQKHENRLKLIFKLNKILLPEEMV